MQIVNIFRNLFSEGKKWVIFYILNGLFFLFCFFLVPYYKFAVYKSCVKGCCTMKVSLCDCFQSLRLLITTVRPLQMFSCVYTRLFVVHLDRVKLMPPSKLPFQNMKEVCCIGAKDNQSPEYCLEHLEGQTALHSTQFSWMPFYLNRLFISLIYLFIFNVSVTSQWWCCNICFKACF